MGDKVAVVMDQTCFMLKVVLTRITVFDILLWRRGKRLRLVDLVKIALLGLLS
jgi:hypothetical protein